MKLPNSSLTVIAVCAGCFLLPTVVPATNHPLLAEDFSDVPTGETPPEALVIMGPGSDARVVDNLSWPTHPFPDAGGKSLFVQTPTSPGHTHVRWAGAAAGEGLVRGTATVVFYPSAPLTRSFLRLADFVLVQNDQGEWVPTVGTAGWAVQLQFGTHGRVFVSSGQVAGDLADQKWLPGEENVLEIEFDAELGKFSLKLNDEEVTVTAFDQPTSEFNFAGLQADTISYINLQVSNVASGGDLFYDSIHIEGEWKEIEVSGLAAWRMEHFQTAENEGEAANDADPDGDGVPNLIEYALGGDPQAPDRSILPVLSIKDDRLVLEVTRPVGLPDIIYTIEYSTDLVNWQSGEEHVTLADPVDNGDGTEALTARSVATVSAEVRGFLRLKIEEAL